METKNYLFLVVLFAALGVFAMSALRLISYLGFAKPDMRWDRIPERLKQTLLVGFAQTKILRDKVAGPLHAGIFWGFLVLLAAATESVLEGIHPALNLNFLGPLYSLLTILIDVFCLVIILGSMMALWRRYITKVRRLQVEAEKVEAAMILLTIFSIVTSLLLQNAARVSLGIDYSFAVRPVSTAVAAVLPLGHTAHEIFWWMHIILILCFTNYLPYSKHLHVLTSIPNVFFSTIGYPNKLEKIDFEQEGIEKFGVNDIEDLSWKSLLDGYTCTHCGRCTSVCPANQTGKVLDPREIIIQIHHRTMDKGPLMAKLKDVGDNALQQERKQAVSGILGGKTIDVMDDIQREIFTATLTEEEQTTWGKKLIGDYVNPDALWACTTCGACMQECPVNIEHVPAIVGMRRSMVMMESNFNEEAALLPDIYGNIENNAVPWGGMAASDRALWAEGMNIKTVADDSDMEVLFWVGCAGSYDERAKSITKAFAELMQIAGVNFRILGTEERCTGDPARRSGNEYLADMFTKMNVETMNMYGVKQIVTTCPHCFNTLKNDYPQFGGDYNVMHHSQYIRSLTESGRLVVNTTAVSAQTVAYHDSCYLGRYNEEFEAPRATLNSVPGLQILEVPRSGDKGFCCGAGGARMFMEETVGERVNINRTNELLNTGAQTIAVNCPFCTTMITDGVKAAEKIDSVAVKDISEILLAS
ncbi:MAG: (Fe-S)-binding protein, partial [Candidatus Kapabacteria bacterium]|nr:(Fe-S)-binding protein [Candidatus Kapabacteria bacterium]